MSWSKGSTLMSSIIETMNKHVGGDENRYAVYKDLIVLFEDYDCDTLYECLDGGDPAYTEAFAETHPGWGEDDDW